MKRFGLAICAGIALIVWSSLTGGKEGMFLFLAGAIVLSLTLVFAVSRSRVSKKATGGSAKTNAGAVSGAIIGMICGGFAGAWSGLGGVMIGYFNPELSEQDFAALFGALGGGIAGAFIGAILGGALQLIRRGHSKA